MRIALLGTRGIPARYGGFETFAEEISARLAERGHEVTVYCRSHYAVPGLRAARGARLCVLPTLRAKHLDTPVHTLLATLHLLLLGRADVALYCNGANAVFCSWPRLRGVPTVLNVDGLERRRRKWKALAKAWYRFSERIATLCPTAVVTDARAVHRYYLDRYGLSTVFIPYGAPRGPVSSVRELEALRLAPGDYYLYVSRFEPENNALRVCREFERTTTRRRLVMVGDAPYAAAYIREVRATRDPRILFPGSIYGRGYAELQSHCRAYIHATEAGGTHPALVEAMGRRCVVLYLDNPENREVAGRSGLAWTRRTGSLADRIGEIELAGEGRISGLRDASGREARAGYSWEAVADAYEGLLASIVPGPVPCQ